MDTGNPVKEKCFGESDALSNVGGRPKRMRTKNSM